jgi:hypothetical protein
MPSATLPLAQSESFTRLQKIAEISLSGLTTLTIPIPASQQPYKLLRFQIWAHWAAGGSSDEISLRLSTGGVVDSGANYNYHKTEIQSGGGANITTVVNFTSISCGNGTALFAGNRSYSVGRFDIYRPAEPKFKVMLGESTSPETVMLRILAGIWKNTGVIDGISLNALAGNAWDSGSLVRVFGER